MFSCKFHIIFQNKFFMEHLQTSASDSSVAFISTSLLFFPEGITYLKLTNKVREKHPRVLFWCLFNLLGRGFRIYPICACSLKVSNEDTGAIPLFYYLYWWLLKGIRSKGLVFISKGIFPLFHSGQTVLWPQTINVKIFWWWESAMLWHKIWNTYQWRSEYDKLCDNEVNRVVSYTLIA